jgi:hypothetical protein
MGGRGSPSMMTVRAPRSVALGVTELVSMTSPRTRTFIGALIATDFPSKVRKC